MKKMVRTAFVLACLACAFLLLNRTSSAQAVYGSIFGTVTDATGAAVPGATVTITNVGKGTVVTTTSSASGDYSVPHLIPDIYNLKVTANGFKSFETKGIGVSADTAPRIDPALEVGGASDTIEVNAGTQPDLKTDRADVATVFDTQMVSSLPVGDQNFTNLQLLLPGAQLLGWSHAASENPQASKQIMVDGQSFSGTAFQLDGTDNQDPILGIIVINPTMDSLSETKITTQNFDAEIGMAVSSVMAAQTKSGTSHFHGDVYDFRTSNANLARDPFSQTAHPDPTITGVIPPPIAGGIKNRFGGAFGGPVPVWKLKDRFFFFGNYEGTRQRTGTTATVTLPTSLATESCLGNQADSQGGNGCDFSEYLTQLGASGTIYDTTIVDPETHQIKPQAFSNNIIPRSKLGAASAPALALLGALEPYTKGLGLGGGGKLNGLDGNYFGSGTGGLNADQWTVRADLSLGEGKHAFGRFTRYTDTLTGTRALGAAGGPGFGIGGFGGTSKGADDSLAGGMDIAFSPKLLMDFRLGYYRYNIGTSKADQDTKYADELGMPGLNTSDSYTGGSPGFSFDTLPNGNTQPNYGDGLNINRCNCPLTQREDQGQIVNNWTLLMGSHSIKVGADLRYARNLRVPSDNNRTGLLTFGTGPTSNGSTGGLGFATFMLGEVTQLDRYVSTSTNAKERQKRTFFYVQDSWRATRNLTINYGVRWELYFPESVNGPNRGSLMNLDDGYLHVAGVGGINPNMDWNIEKKKMFAPRLGITYQLDPKTVIRAGYGRSFDIGVFGSVFGHTVTQNLPVLANQQIKAENTFGQAFLLNVGPPAPDTVEIPSNGLLPNPGASVNSRARPNPMRFPTIDAWNLAIQRVVTQNLTLTMAYVGNKGTHTFGDNAGNTTNPNEPAIFLPAQYGPSGQALHWDNSVAPNTIAADGGTSTINYLKRYYYGSLAACTDAAYTRPAGVAAGQCGWTNDITYYGDNRNTKFDAMQVTVAQAPWKGLSYTANYQWARAWAPNGDFSTWDIAAVRGNDTNVRRQQLTWFGTYSLPFGKGKQFGSGTNRITDLLIGGYELSGVVNWAGGLPFNLSYGESGQNVGAGGKAPSYPSYAGPSGHMKTELTSFKAKSSGTGTRTFYTKQTDNLLTDPGTGIFKNPGLDTIGNVGRNTYLGPSFFNSDIAISKAFTIHENLVTKFRMDAFNAFNHINPGNPSGGIEQDGTITSEATGATPRQLEFSLRIQF